jgi:tetratricopeptide (TPR) repeat protein
VEQPTQAGRGASHRASGGAPARPSALLDFLVAALVALAAAAPFVRSVGYPFLQWDDDVNFFTAPQVRSLSSDSLRWMWSTFHVGHFAPLTWMSCALDFELAADDPARQLHLTNLALHGATAAALFIALRALLALSLRPTSATRLGASAALGALFWALHPLRTESVAWLTERRDVLSGLFYALTFLAWFASQPDGARRRLWLALSVLAFAAALLSKVSGVAVPLVMLMLDFWPLGNVRRHGLRRAVLEKAPFLALSAAAVVAGLTGQSASTQVLAGVAQLGILERLGIASYAALLYLAKTLVPTGLGPLYELPQHVSIATWRLGGALLLGLAFAATLHLLRRRSNAHACLWTALVAFALLLAPVSGLAHAGRQIAADRYTYLPSFALAALAAAALHRFASRTLWIASAIAAALLAGASWRQTAYWKDTTTLFERAVELEPGAYWANHKLGVLAHQAGQPQRALEHYDRALAARPAHGHADACYDRALSHLLLGDSSAARSDLERALADAPTHAGALNVLTDLDRNEKRLDRALERLRGALARAPTSRDLTELLATTLLDAEQNEAALAAAKQLQVLAPEDPRGYSLAGTASLYLGRFADAERELRRACELAPTAERYYSLGLALERQGRPADARASFERVLELQPAHARARAKLGRP